MNQPPENDWLNRVLKDEPPYINDDGFTARVVAGLPPKRRHWLRPVIIGTATVAGILLTFSITPPVELLNQILAWTYYGIPLIPVGLALAFMVVSVKFAIDEP